VQLQIKLSFEGVVDRLEELPDRFEVPLAGMEASRSVAARGSPASFGVLAARPEAT
jgi:hypothetical protein